LVDIGMAHPTIRAVPPTHAPSYDTELSVAIEAARLAGRLQMERYERLERIVHKGEHDVVTEVDTLSEQLIIDLLHEAFPADAFLAEESGRSRVAGGAANGSPDTTDQRMWIIDPLDGTVNYANGIPLFCVSVGLAVAGQPVVGVIYDPVRDEMFTAVAGRGARLDGEPIRQPRKDKLSDLVLSLAMPSRGWTGREREVRKRIRVSRILGSAALSLAYVGNGRFDGFVQAGGLSLWDICAAGLIASEGGAAVTAGDGGPWFDMARPNRSIGVVAAAPVHHATLLELLR
jgi:myo-inositol-1(or 4)-monophosphatase